MPSRPAAPIPATVAGIESIAAAPTSSTRSGGSIMAVLEGSPLSGSSKGVHSNALTPRCSDIRSRCRRREHRGSLASRCSDTHTRCRYRNIAAASTSTSCLGVVPVLPFGRMAALGNDPLQTGLVSSRAIAAAGAFGSKKGSIPHPRGGGARPSSRLRQWASICGSSSRTTTRRRACSPSSSAPFRQVP